MTDCGRTREVRFGATTRRERTKAIVASHAATDHLAIGGPRLAPESGRKLDTWCQQPCVNRGHRVIGIPAPKRGRSCSAL